MIDPQPLAAGDEGELVEELQRRLHYLNYYTGDITGRYDDATETAVREFQDAWSLETDGAMSVDAWDKLENAATSADFYEPTNDVGGEAAGDGGLAPGTLSDDGQYQWDGAEWQAVGGDAGGDSGGEILSEDGQYRWDGENWVPVGGEQPAEQAATQETPVLSEEQFAQMVSGSMSISDEVTA